MLVGCLIRHYKVYENIVFTPITLGVDGSFTVFTGNNGVGKSSILEAINHFFHQTKWIVNNKAKKSEAYIAPIFLIKKDEFKPTGISSDLLESISTYFWSVTESANATISKNNSLKDFLLYRDKLKRIYEINSFYLLLVGLKYPSDTSNFITFDSDIRKELTSQGFDSQQIDKLYKAILNHYSYVYIPVESATQNILKFESFELQELMDRDVLNEIDTIINNKIKVPRESLGKDRGPKEISLTPLKLINDKLDKFIEEANESIEKIGTNYQFGTQRGQKKKLYVQDIRDSILDEYFSIRVLRKDGKLIEDLSSGEQRIALFDIAYSLLSQGKRTKKNLIFAVDEPESSMHMSQCFKQFLRLSEICSEYNHQVLITSHWYGFIPVIKCGYINHIDHDSGLKITQHSLQSVMSDQKSLPDEISLKSMFDLVSSVIGMMRSERSNWLICEGVDDQIYLNAFLKKRIDKLILLPVGGIDNVIKVYNYLYTPLSEKCEKSFSSGRVLCLTDTDNRPVHPENHKSLKGNKLTLRRFNNKDEVVDLLELNPNSERNITVIEDILDAKMFFNSCKDVINNCEDEEVKDIFKNMKLCDGAKYTGFSDNLSSVDGLTIEYHKRKDKLIRFLSDHQVKYQLATNYIEHYNKSEDAPPEWVESIEKIFN